MAQGSKNLQTEVRTGAEICHYAGNGLVITSLHNRISIERSGTVETFDLPIPFYAQLAGWSRLVRRALRWDKCNIVPLGDNADQLIIIRQGRVYHLDWMSRTLTETLKLEGCRNVLHQSIAVIGEQELIFGEYGGNPERKSVPVYRSTDGGRNWQVVFRFPAGKIKHVHGCFHDPYTDKIWTLTGDYEGECHMLVSNHDFSETEYLGDGGQLWRACNLFFRPDEVYWLMDSPVETSHLVRFDRASGVVETLQAFPGPIWYIKKLTDQRYLAATASEIGPSVADNEAHLFLSDDLQNWQEISTFPHDGWPRRYFKFGVVGFADGPQDSGRFFMFGEALRGFDGRVLQCKITDV